MTAEQLFSIINLAILPAWVLLLFLPCWKGTRVVVHSAVAPAILTGVYVVALILMYTQRAPSEATGFEATQELLASPWGLVTLWAHVVAFDLFVGAWQVRDAARYGLSQWIVAPTLLLTLFYGPIGLSLYLLIRGLMRKTASVIEVQRNSKASELVHPGAAEAELPPTLGPN